MSKKIIKRYANRKLYDTGLSRYITLERIWEMLQSGQDVEVVDSKTGKDLTSVTLAQVLFEEEKRAAKKPAFAMLQDVFQSGQKVADRVQHSMAALGKVGQMAAEVKSLQGTIADMEKRLARLELERKK